jgi:phage baseplate assembly protein W
MHIDYPYHFGPTGRTATTDDDDSYLRDLIELVLFTSPGERVNNPTFGCGLMQLVFSPNSQTVAAATQLAVQGALQQWLGNLIQAQAVVVNSADSTLSVQVTYIVRATQQSQTATFTRSL